MINIIEILDFHCLHVMLTGMNLLPVLWLDCSLVVLGMGQSGRKVIVAPVLMGQPDQNAVGSFAAEICSIYRSHYTDVMRSVV
jgi:hypothetical protein